MRNLCASGQLVLLAVSCHNAHHTAIFWNAMVLHAVSMFYCTRHEFLAQNVQATTRFKATAIPAKKPYYRTNESPDVWFEPTEVWEIRGADLTISPVHKAAVGHIHPDRGISLRYLLLLEYTPTDKLSTLPSLRGIDT